MGISRPEHLLTRRAGIRANGTRRRRLLRFGAAALAVLLVSATAAADSATAQNAAPLRPTGLEAAAVSHDSVTLNWDASDDDSITGYRILRRDIVNQPPGTFATVEDDTASADASYIDGTVQPETRYAYRIVALSDAGESRRSGYVNVTTPAEPAASRRALRAGAAGRREEIGLRPRLGGRARNRRGPGANGRRRIGSVGRCDDGGFEPICRGAALRLQPPGVAPPGLDGFRADRLRRFHLFHPFRGVLAPIRDAVVRLGRPTGHHGGPGAPH